MALRCEILSTGDEVLTGQIVDTNATYLADRLGALGFEVVRHTTVGDDRAILAATIREIGARADVVLVTGGLGPTVDDLTTEVVAEVLGCGLALDEPALARMRSFWESRGREMPENNRKQAMIPVAAEVLPNPIGTAPGFTAKIERASFFFMPGVPREMKRMLAEQVEPRLERLRPEPTVFDVRVLRSFGLTESAADQLLSDLPARFPQVKLGFRAHFPEIQVKATGKGSSGDEIRIELDRFTAEVRARLGPHLFSEGEPMEAVVGELLRRRQATVAVADAGTGGMVAELLTRVPGASDSFTHGFVAWTDQAHTDLIGVGESLLREHGAVSEPCARAMAEGARTRALATHALAITGFASPGGGTPDRPVCLVWIALATAAGTEARRLAWPGRREQIRALVAMSALDMLRRELSGFLTEGWSRGVRSP